MYQGRVTFQAAIPLRHVEADCMSRSGRLTDLFVFEAACDGPRAFALFTMPQSLATYAVAICVVATMTRAVRTLLRPEADSLLVPLVASLVVGAGISLAVASDPRTRPRGPMEWATAAMVA